MRNITLAIDDDVLDKVRAYAVETARNFRISYWDAAIVAAAAPSSASVLYSGDLNHGQRYGAVQVVNPFRTQ